MSTLVKTLSCCRISAYTRNIPTRLISRSFKILVDQMINQILVHGLRGLHGKKLKVTELFHGSTEEVRGEPSALTDKMRPCQTCTGTRCRCCEPFALSGGVLFVEVEAGEA